MNDESTYYSSPNKHGLFKLKFDKTNSVNGSNSAEKTRKVINSNKDNQRNSWLLVANDGVGRDHLVFFCRIVVRPFDSTTKILAFFQSFNQ